MEVCKFYCGLDSLFMSVSINILVVMCNDRYLAIKKPFRATSDNVKLVAFIKVLIAVSISALITAPMFCFSHVRNAAASAAIQPVPHGWSKNNANESFPGSPNDNKAEYMERNITQSYQPNSGTIDRFRLNDSLENLSTNNSLLVKNYTNSIGENTVDNSLRCFLKPPDNYQRTYFVFQYLAIFVVPGTLLAWLYYEILQEFKEIITVVYHEDKKEQAIMNESSLADQKLAHTCSGVPCQGPSQGGGGGTSQTVNERMFELNLSRKRKVTRIIMVIILLFMVCYLPFNSMILFQMFLHTSPWGSRWYKVLHFLFVTLTYINSCANPFLYTLLCKRYRIIFVKYFPLKNTNCYCFVPATTDPTPTTVKKRREKLVYSARRKQFLNDQAPHMMGENIQLVEIQPNQTPPQIDWKKPAGTSTSI